jgi:pimeloyl-ACP methyl ester carboxylesterase
VSGKKFVFVEEEEAVFLPIWREVFTGVDWARLRASLVYYGGGIEKGHGEPVITVPGFLGSDTYLMEMNWWLRRIGYKPYKSGIGRNSECPDLLVDKLITTIERAYDETGKKVRLVGHSLGGMLSRSAALIAADKVAAVITLGSPFRGVRSHPTVLQTGKFVRQQIRARREGRPGHKPLRESCFSGSCNCGFVESLRAGLPASIHQTAIYTKTDGIVDWEVCITGDPGIDIEVKGTHCGLAWNASVYRLIAERLADAAGEVANDAASDELPDADLGVSFI